MVRASLYEKDINQKTLQISKLESKLTALKKNPYYNKYIVVDYINKNTGHLNYAVLYEYLNQLRKNLLSEFKQFKVNRLVLQVQPEKITIKTAVPNYDVIYKSWGMIDKLSNQVFVKKINISEFKNINNTVNFNIGLQTK